MSENCDEEVFTYAVTESMDTGSSIGQDVKRFERKARVVEVVATAPFTGISHCITHARLVTLRFTKRQARPVTTQSFLQAFRSVRLRRRYRTFSFGTFRDK